MKTKLLLLGLLLSVQFAFAQVPNPYPLTIHVWLEGLYIPNANPEEMYTPLYTCGPNQCSEYLTDYIIISLYDDNCNEVQKEIGLLAKTGEVMVFLGSNMPLNPNTFFQSEYWIRVQHRNHVDVWSKESVPFYSTGTTYNFKTDNGFNPAYEDGYFPPSQVEVAPGVWAMYAGDLNNDCAVDALDMTIVSNAAPYADYQYQVADLNGDCAADALDMTFIENNSNIAVYCEAPCSIDPCFVARKAKSKGNTIETSMELSVRPNPSNDNIEVVTNKDQCSLKITNAVGEIVYEEKMDYQTNIKVANFPKGIYFLTIERNGNVEGKKKISLQ